MEYLLRLTEDEEIRGIVDASLRNPAVQGVVLDLDAFWLKCWQIRSEGGRKAERRLDRLFDYWYYQRRSRFPLEFALRAGISEEPTAYNIPARPLQKRDLKWRPKFWRYYARESGIPEEALPIVVKVCFRPAEEEERGELEIRESRYRVVYETRPVATLYGDPRALTRPLVGGVSIGHGPRISGTLGGILEDRAGKRYGLTCAHVVGAASAVIEQPAESDRGYFSGTAKRGLSKNGAGIGSCVLSSQLRSSAKEEICNPYQSAPMNEVDAALIRLDKSVGSSLEIMELGPVSRITPRASLTPGQMVETAGKASRNRKLVVGGLAVTYRFRSATGEYHCFRNLFELRWPNFWRLAYDSPVRKGDSGSWVCNPSASGFGWCGMVVGGDRMLGYAQFSETVQEWWMKQKLDLRIS